MSGQNVLVRVPVVSEPPPTTEKGEASAIWPRPKRHGSGKGYLGPLAPMPVKSYRAEYSHSSLNICSSGIFAHCGLQTYQNKTQRIPRYVQEQARVSSTPQQHTAVLQGIALPLLGSTGCLPLEPAAFTSHLVPQLTWQCLGIWLTDSKHLDPVGIILMKDLQNLEAIAVRLLLANSMRGRQALAEGGNRRQKRPQVPHLFTLQRVQSKVHKQGQQPDL